VAKKGSYHFLKKKRRHGKQQKDHFVLLKQEKDKFPLDTCIAVPHWLVWGFGLAKRECRRYINRVVAVVVVVAAAVVTLGERRNDSTGSMLFWLNRTIASLLFCSRPLLFASG